MNAPWNRAGDAEPAEMGRMLTYAIDNAQCWATAVVRSLRDALSCFASSLASQSRPYGLPSTIAGAMA